MNQEEKWPKSGIPNISSSDYALKCGNSYRDENSSQILFEDSENGITYRTMIPSDIKAVLPVAARAFWKGEPTTGAGGATLKDFEIFCGMYIPRMAEKGITIVAVETSTGKI
jgi:GNAT superfamily N-acetyltransferase